MRHTPVLFLRADPPYMAGEVASFADPVAAQLVRRGIARVHEPTPAVEPPAVERAGDEAEADDGAAQAGGAAPRRGRARGV